MLKCLVLPLFPGCRPTRRRSRCLYFSLSLLEIFVTKEPSRAWSLSSESGELPLSVTGGDAVSRAAVCMRVVAWFTHAARRMAPAAHPALSTRRCLSKNFFKETEGLKRQINWFSPPGACSGPPGAAGSAGEQGITCADRQQPSLGGSSKTAVSSDFKSLSSE